jgi:hypothetical protein
MSDAFGVPGAGADLASSLRGIALTVLLAANTLAAGCVETSRDVQFSGADPCAIAIYTSMIDRTWIGDGPPNFKAVVHLVIVGRVLRKLLKQAETDLDVLRVQIENAVLGSPQFWAAIEQMPAVNTTMEFPGTTDLHEGIVTMTMQCQGTDTFAPIETTPLEMIQVVVPNPNGGGPAPAPFLIGAEISLPNVDEGT